MWPVIGWNGLIDVVAMVLTQTGVVFTLLSPKLSLVAFQLNFHGFLNEYEKGTGQVNKVRANVIT